MPTNFSEWVTIIGLIFNILQTVLVAVTIFNSDASGRGEIRSGNRRNLFIMSALALVSWIIFAWLEFGAKRDMVFVDSIIGGWSYSDGTFSVDLHGEPIRSLKNANRVILFVKVI